MALSASGHVSIAVHGGISVAAAGRYRRHGAGGRTRRGSTRIQNIRVGMIECKRARLLDRGLCEYRRCDHQGENCCSTDNFRSGHSSGYSFLWFAPRLAAFENQDLRSKSARFSKMRILFKSRIPPFPRRLTHEVGRPFRCATKSGFRPAHFALISNGRCSDCCRVADRASAARHRTLTSAAVRWRRRRGIVTERHGNHPRR